MKLLNQLIGKKAILGILLSVAMAAGFLIPAMGVSAAGPSTLSIYMTPYNGSPAVLQEPNSSTFNVQFDIDNSVAISSFQFEVDYDPTALQFNNATEGTFLTAHGNPLGLQSDSTVPGKVQAIADSLKNSAYVPAGETGSTLVTLNFTALKSNVATQITVPTGINPATQQPYIVLLAADGITVVTSPATQVAGGTIDIGTVLAQPVVSSFSPTTGAAGTSMTIMGTGFTGATSVLFGSTAVTIPASTSDTSITVTVPNLGTTNLATQAITVANSQFSSSSATGSTTSTFAYTTTPTITSFTPPSGIISSTVTISGTGFVGVTSVKINGTACTNVTPNAAGNSITAVVASGTTSGLINVANATTGTTGVNSATSFTVLTAGITGFLPLSGYTGDLVTITGSGFTGCTGVNFGGTNAPTFTVISNTQMTAVVPNGSTGKINVGTPSGIVSSTANFTYEQVAISMAPSTQQLTSINQTFTISLNINTNGTKQIRGWQASFSFDPTQLQCTGVTEGSFFTSFVTANSGTSTSFGSATIDNTDGTITGLYDALLGNAQAGGQTGSGTVATLSFKAIGGAGAMVSVAPSNVIVTDVNGTAIPNIIVAGASVTLSPNVPSSSVPVNANLYPQLTLIAPAPINGWDLVVSANNNVQRTLNVFANTNWQVTVASDSTNGYLTEWNGTAYVPSVQLANPLFINSVSLATGGVLATGTPAQQNANNGGDIQNIMFNQAVTYTDPIVGAPNTYHTMVIFTASNTSY